MDIGVDLNGKYAIMSLKTVLIPENDEELTHSGFRQYCTYNSDIFSGTSETIMHSPFNTGNHSSVSSNFSTILPIPCVVGRLCEP